MLYLLALLLSTLCLADFFDADVYYPGKPCFNEWTSHNKPAWETCCSEEIASCNEVSDAVCDFFTSNCRYYDPKDMCYSVMELNDNTFSMHYSNHSWKQCCQAACDFGGFECHSEYCVWWKMPWFPLTIWISVAVIIIITILIACCCCGCCCCRSAKMSEKKKQKQQDKLELKKHKLDLKMAAAQSKKAEKEPASNDQVVPAAPIIIHEHPFQPTNQPNNQTPNYNNVHHKPVINIYPQTIGQVEAQPETYPVFDEQKVWPDESSDDSSVRVIVVKHQYEF